MSFILVVTLLFLVNIVLQYNNLLTTLQNARQAFAGIIINEIVAEEKIKKFSTYMPEDKTKYGEIFAAIKAEFDKREYEDFWITCNMLYGVETGTTNFKIIRILFHFSGKRTWTVSIPSHQFNQRIIKRNNQIERQERIAEAAKSIRFHRPEKILNDISFDLGIPFQDKSPYEKYKIIEKNILDRYIMVPHVNLPGVSTISSIWYLGLIITILLTLINNRMLYIVDDPELGIGEPFFLFDAKTITDKLIANIWFYIVLFSPWICAGIAAFTISRKNQLDGINLSAYDAISKSLMILIIIIVGGQSSISVIYRVKEVIRKRKQLDDEKKINELKQEAFI
jgi:hypothetical protein